MTNNLLQCPFILDDFKWPKLIYYAPRKISGEHIVVALSVRPSVRQSVRPSVRPICVRPITSLFEVGF